jgi:hypothetical protein
MKFAYIYDDHSRKLAEFSELPTENSTQIRDSKKSVSAQQSKSSMNLTIKDFTWHNNAEKLR